MLQARFDYFCSLTAMESAICRPRLIAPAYTVFEIKHEMVKFRNIRRCVPTAVIMNVQCEMLVPFHKRRHMVSNKRMSVLLTRKQWTELNFITGTQK
jgi:hypothetical protein